MYIEIERLNQILNKIKSYKELSSYGAYLEGVLDTIKQIKQEVDEYIDESIKIIDNSIDKEM